MMSPEARAAHKRFCEQLSAATRHLDRPVHGLAAEAMRAYAEALRAKRSDDLAWREFISLVALLDDTLERASCQPSEIVAELRALLRENDDLLVLEPAFG
jgi:hypothetical protein